MKTTLKNLWRKLEVAAEALEYSPNDAIRTELYRLNEEVAMLRARIEQPVTDVKEANLKVVE